MIGVIKVGQFLVHFTVFNNKLNNKDITIVESGKMMTYAAVAVGAIGVAGLLFWMSKPPRLAEVPLTLARTQDRAAQRCRRMRRKLITKFTTLKGAATLFLTTCMSTG